MRKSKSSSGKLSWLPRDPQEWDALTVRRFLVGAGKVILESIFAEAAGQKRFVSPDAAMDALWGRWDELFSPLPDEPVPCNFATCYEGALTELSPATMARLSFVAVDREIHHFAVDEFYRTYFPRQGAPPLDPDYLKRLQRFRAQGLSRQEIALKIFKEPKYADRIRKQLKIADQRPSEENKSACRIPGVWK